MKFCALILSLTGSVLPFLYSKLKLSCNLTEKFHRIKIDTWHKIPYTLLHHETHMTVNMRLNVIYWEVLVGKHLSDAF
jgi:hypothetical protein